MDNVVSINNTKENTIEFELTSEGLKSKEMNVRLIVEAKGMCLSFDASHKKGDTWAIKVPRLTGILEKTAYPFCIEVVCDGYHFEPMKGTFNVEGSAKLFAEGAKNVTFGPADGKPVEKKEREPLQETKRVVPTRQRERSIEQIAEQLIEQEKLSPEKIKEKIEEAKEVEAGQDKEKDRKVLAILEEIGYRPKTKRKISFVTTKLLNS